MPDDWGCINADSEKIKGLAYPKRKKVTVQKIDALKAEYFEAGKLFLWFEGDREWGFFTSFEKHHPNFCNATHVDGDGKQVRHKRKTPEPPEKELKEYLEKYLYKEREVKGKLERGRAVKDKYRVPNPNPIPNPKDILSGKPDLVYQVIEYLNQVLGTKYRATSEKTRRLVAARRKEKYTFEDFKKVIDKKAAEWKGDDEFAKFLRPETLFSAKFEGYLNQINPSKKTRHFYKTPEPEKQTPEETKAERAAGKKAIGDMKKILKNV